MRGALLLFALLACREGGDAFNDAATDAPPDGVDGTGCTPMTPRTTPVQAFVGPAGLQDRVEAAIDSAQKSLDIQMYLFSVKDIAQHVVAARQRGVAIRAILDPDESANKSIESILSNGGVQWKNSSTVYQYSHAKYLVIDRATTVVMSMNFNPDAMTTERNYGFVDQDPEDVTDVQNVFEMDWQLAQGKTPVAADLNCTRMIVSPNSKKISLSSSLNEDMTFQSTTQRSHSPPIMFRDPKQGTTSATMRPVITFSSPPVT